MAESSHSSSFRDPAGHIFMHDGKLYRQINNAGKEHYESLMSSGLYERLVSEGLLVAHKEVALKKLEPDSNRYKVIKPDKIPFISYPYEWTFSQLKDAALLTMKIQRLALEHQMILKDASAYNVQFIGKKPVFIDTLSLRPYGQGEAWEGYKQFCEHFLAPLAVAAYSSPEFLRTMRTYIDGLPLSVAVSLLPASARLNRGLLAHLYLHAASQRRYDAAGHQAAKKIRKISPIALAGLMVSLEKAVKRLKTKSYRTEWGQYYSDTNYSGKAFQAKKQIVKDLIKLSKPSVVWDLGANDGTFSSLAAENGAYSVAFDVDMNAVEQNYHNKALSADKLLPLVLDLANPSPAIGWAHEERQSLAARGPADTTLALALIHHLAIGNNLPLSAVAEYFSTLTSNLIIEFVPKEDSKVQLLLASRKDIFPGYNQDGFESSFAKYFKMIYKKPVAGSKRVIYLYSK